MVESTNGSSSAIRIFDCLLFKGYDLHENYPNSRQDYILQCFFATLQKSPLLTAAGYSLKPISGR